MKLCRRYRTKTLMQMISKTIVLCMLVAITTTLLCQDTRIIKAAVPRTFSTQSSSTTFVILSTQDMQGNCWDTNLLNGEAVNNSMLRIASAVKALREKYKDNIVLINSGNTFQGTPLSTYSLTTANKKFNGETPMAIGLKYIGYDAFSLSNQEWSYSYEIMEKVYSYLQNKKDSRVPVISGNLVYKKTQGIHKEGELVYRPWTSKEIKVGEKRLKVGILGLENTDFIRWNVTDNASNTSYNMAVEAQPYITQMQKEGCDFIIVSYHCLQSGDSLQALHMIKNTSGIDMMITSYHDLNNNTRTIYEDKKGNSVLVVNAGSNQLAKIQIEATVKKDGTFDINIPGEQSNVDLSKFKEDQVLKGLIKPYVTEVTNYLNESCGIINKKEWDAKTNLYLEQTDTMDFINRAKLEMGSKYMKKKFAPTSPVPLKTLQKTYGNKYTLDVDLSCSTVATLENYTVKPGDLTMKDMYKLYSKDNSLCILPLTGAQLKQSLEYVASKQLTYAISNGKMVFLTKGDNANYPVFYGVDFSYDLSKEVGSRVKIKGFQNGKSFSLIQTYNLAVDDDLLGNGAFQKYGAEDTIWSQRQDLNGKGIRGLMKEFTLGFGKKGVSPKRSDWKIEYRIDEK